MLKLVLLVAAFGSVLCETHNQQVKYANSLILEIYESSYEFIEAINNIKEYTIKGNLQLIEHANLLNFNIHFIIDSLQHFVEKSNVQAAALQDIVLKLNRVTYVLEKSIKYGDALLKTNLILGAIEIVYVAEDLQMIIQKNVNLAYTSTVLRFLDDLVNVIQTSHLRAVFYNTPKFLVKNFTKLIRKILTSMLLYFNNSTNVNVYNDIVRYSSKLSSDISETGRLLNDLTFTYKPNNVDDVKKIMYSLSKIVQDNEEVLYNNEKSFKKIKKQFGVTLDNFGKQLDKIIDAGYSKNGWTIQDKNLIYVVVPKMLGLSFKLQRNLIKTIENYIDVKST